MGGDIESELLQGQHGNITLSRYKAAMSCGEAELEQESSQRTAGGRRRSRTWSGVSKISDNMKPHSDCVGTLDLFACLDSRYRSAHVSS